MEETGSCGAGALALLPLEDFLQEPEASPAVAEPEPAPGSEPDPEPDGEAASGGEALSDGGVECRVGPASARAVLAFAVTEIRRVNGAGAARAGGLSPGAACFSAAGALSLDLIDADDALALDVLESSRFPRLIPDCWRESADAERLLYRCAWLKAHFPVEFLAALMECGEGPAQRLAAAAEARRVRIPLLPADINFSGRTHLVTPARGKAKAIRLPLPGGLFGAPSVGSGRAHALSERDWDRLRRARPFSSLADVVARARLPRGLLMDAAQAGAFDSLVRREGEAEEAARARAITLTRQSTATGRKRGADGQLELIGEEDVEVRQPGAAQSDAAEASAAGSFPFGSEVERSGSLLETEVGGDGEREGADEETALAAEESAGALIAGEPLRAEFYRGSDVAERFAPLLAELGVTPLGELPAFRPGSEVVLAGLRVSAPGSGRGEALVEVSIEDGTGRVDAVLGGGFHSAVHTQLAGISRMVLHGRVRDDEGGGTVLEADEVHDLTQMWRDWQALRGG